MTTSGSCKLLGRASCLILLSLSLSIEGCVTRQPISVTLPVFKCSGLLPLSLKDPTRGPTLLQPKATTGDLGVLINNAIEALGQANARGDSIYDAMLACEARAQAAQDAIAPPKKHKFLGLF